VSARGGTTPRATPIATAARALGAGGPGGTTGHRGRERSRGRSQGGGSDVGVGSLAGPVGPALLLLQGAHRRVTRAREVVRCQTQALADGGHEPVTRGEQGLQDLLLFIDGVREDLLRGHRLVPHEPPIPVGVRVLRAEEASLQTARDADDPSVQGEHPVELIIAH
jgi:hypothetical protein